MAVDSNDPRPVLRKELEKVFKNQRVIRAFEKLFDLVPPEFIDQQQQIDALVTAITILTDAISIAPTLTPVSDLVNLTSYPMLDTTITVSWSGLHTFANGANVTGTLAVTGNITATTTIAATGAISGSNLSASGGANPSASVGLTAVNGVAITYMRSDGSPPINQGIAPTWSAQHIYSLAGAGLGAGILLSSANPAIALRNTSGAVDEKLWDWNALAGVLVLRTKDDTGGGAKNAIAIFRTGTAQTDFEFGNATDNPNYTFLGTKTLKHGGSQLIQGSAGFTNNAAANVATITNSPLAGNPTKWIPINDNGTIRNIPAW